MKKLIYLIILNLIICKISAQSLQTGTYSGIYSFQKYSFDINQMEMYIFKSLNITNDSIYNILYSIKNKDKILEFAYADGIFDKSTNKLTVKVKLYFFPTGIWPGPAEKLTYDINNSYDKISFEAKPESVPILVEN